MPSLIEDEVLPSAELERRLTLLRATWAYFDDVVGGVTGELLPSGRVRGRTASRSPATCTSASPSRCRGRSRFERTRDVVMTPDGLAAHREAYLDAIRAWNAEGKRARTWPIQFLIRRTAHHVMDHAWELEDRDPAAPPES